MSFLRPKQVRSCHLDVIPMIRQALRSRKSRNNQPTSCQRQRESTHIPIHEIRNGFRIVYGRVGHFFVVLSRPSQASMPDDPSSGIYSLPASADAEALTPNKLILRPMVNNADDTLAIPSPDPTAQIMTFFHQVGRFRQCHLLRPTRYHEAKNPYVHQRGFFPVLFVRFPPNHLHGCTAELRTSVRRMNMLLRSFTPSARMPVFHWRMTNKFSSAP